MSEQDHPRRLTLHGAANYTILVQGALGRHWGVELGMRITHSERDHVVVTRLVGRLPDQAALAGVLQRLYGLGYPLIAVTLLPDDEMDAASTAF